MTRVYLCGPINGCTDAECNDWRAYAKAELAKYDIGTIDPMDRDYRGREMEPGIATEIVVNDKADICDSHFMIANCPKPSVGTSMEILYAYKRGVPVVAIHPADKPPSPWLVYHADRVVYSMRDAIDWLLA